MSVSIEIETCKQCPSLKKEDYLTADDFEHEVNWICGKSDRPAPSDRDWKPKVENSSRIAMVSWPSEEPKRIPCWCPLRDS